jgi:virginiamycin B lyase
VNFVRRAGWVGLAAVAALSVGCASSQAPAPGPSAPSAAPTDSFSRTTTASAPGTVDGDAVSVRTYPVPSGSRPHDVAPAPDGSVWYTAQGTGELGRLDPSTGATHHVKLGTGSAPHGVILGPDGAPWVTDGGLNAILRVDPRTDDVSRFPLPPGTPNVSLNTAVFARDGTLWFTGQAGYLGHLDLASGRVDVVPAPRGPGPYGITVAPGGAVYYASLAGNHIARVDVATGAATPIDPPTPGQGARRVWADGSGRIWVSEWNAGQLGVYQPQDGSWKEWKLPGDHPQAYAVYVDERGQVWATDFGGNAIVRFDPTTERFTSFPLPDAGASVRQLLGRPGEVWGAESAADKLVVVRTS